MVTKHAPIYKSHDHLTSRKVGSTTKLQFKDLTSCEKGQKKIDSQFTAKHEQENHGLHVTRLGRSEG